MSVYGLPSLYIHVPFCIKKCDYCAFYSVPFSGQQDGQGSSLVRTYLDGLRYEIELRRQDAPEGVSSLFMGGGTPTALPDQELQDLLDMLKIGFDLPPGIEITAEGNPGTLTSSKMEILISFGVNRFSLGVQSFNDALLQEIGRIHNGEQIRAGIRILRAAGINNLNLDLMFGLPGQNLAMWQESIEEALAFKPEHLSLYGLTLEEGTVFADRFAPNTTGLPDDDLQAEMYQWASERLRKAAYLHYETSNFALPGYECRHNLNYWRGGDYLGLGPGAVSCRDGIRWKNEEDISRCQDKLVCGEKPVAAEEYEALSLPERMAERVILGLRLTEGVNLKSFQDEFGKNIKDIYAQVLERYERQGILFEEKGFLRLNPKYAFVANLILQEFV